MKNPDVIGNAISDFFLENSPEDIITNSSIAGEDVLPTEYLFRKFEDMPKIEQTALGLSKGKIIDIGCAAGSHSLYLQNKGKSVLGIDISEGAVETAKKRGVKNTKLVNIYDLKNESFDTILALMNGTGICGSLNQLTPFLSHLKSLLHPKGQILIDSSDIKYMFEEDEYYLQKSKNYYGETSFTMSYKKLKSQPFDWLYVDFKTLENHAKKAGLNCEMIQKGEHFDYLARLTHIK